MATTASTTDRAPAPGLPKTVAQPSTSSTTGITQRDAAAIRRHELSAFLRSRRERISPAAAGVPIGGRRRTPGLRREEVASLAGVGVTWYTWLEQGRDIKVSDQVLEAISRTLMLDRTSGRIIHPGRGDRAAGRQRLRGVRRLTACSSRPKTGSSAG